jgi:hypothetical protein
LKVLIPIKADSSTEEFSDRELSLKRAVSCGLVIFQLTNPDRTVVVGGDDLLRAVGALVKDFEWK